MSVQVIRGAWRHSYRSARREGFRRRFAARLFVGDVFRGYKAAVRRIP